MSEPATTNLNLDDNPTLCTGLWCLFGILVIIYLWNMMGSRDSCRLDQECQGECGNLQTASEELSLDTLKAVFADTSDTKHCIFVYAEWCGHCKASKPFYEECAQLENDVHFCKVNGGEEESKPLMEFLTKNGVHIRGFPFFVCTQNGKVTKSHTGAFPRDDDGSMKKAISSFIKAAFE